MTCGLHRPAPAAGRGETNWVSTQSPSAVPLLDCADRLDVVRTPRCDAPSPGSPVTQSPRTAALVACDSIVIPGKCHDPVHSHSHPVMNVLGHDVQTASQSGVRTPRCDDWVNVLGHQVVPTRLGEVECAYRCSARHCAVRPPLGTGPGTRRGGRGAGLDGVAECANISLDDRCQRLGLAALSQPMWPSRPDWAFRSVRWTTTSPNAHPASPQYRPSPYDLQEDTHRSRAHARYHQHRFGAREVHAARPSEHVEPIVGLAAVGRLPDGQQK